MERNIFKMAVEQKLRFPFRGSITTEDLFDLSKSQLDSIYRILNQEVKKATEESLLSEKTKEDETLSLQIEIVKEVFLQKQSEENFKIEQKEKQDKKRKLMELLSQKENEEFGRMSKEDIIAELNKL